MKRKLHPSALYDPKRQHFWHTEPADLPNPNWEVLRSPEFQARGRALMRELSSKKPPESAHASR